MSNNLTFYDREKLQYWLRTKISLRKIARLMGKDHSVLSREIRRNNSYGRKGYRADIGQRERYGDWESDSVIFSKQKTALSVQLERKSRLVRMHKVANKTGEETRNALIKSIESLPNELTKTITFDNGTENVKHIELKEIFNLETYFCDPFSSWQKGGVENANKLIRHYLPRETNLSKLTDRDIYQIQEKLNNRPRKSLNYQTPNEVINNYLKVVHY